MHIVSVGLNYKTTPVELRECFAMEDERLPEALQKLQASSSILESVIVATCNRTEIYAVVDQNQVCPHDIQQFMADWFRVPKDKFKDHLYTYQDVQAVKHLFEVTAGLDSMVLGETQILGQVKQAFLTAQAEGATGTMFNELFKQAVTLAKRAQSETSIGENAVSVSYAAVELGKRIFGRFDTKKTLIIGAGKMSELTLKHIQANGSSMIYVANRTLERAQALAETVNGIALTLEQMPSILPDIDIIISSTVIRALQNTASSIHAETMESLFNKLPDLDDRERKLIEKLSKSIVNQLLHDPIAHVKDMAHQRRGKEALELVTELFNLNPESDKPE
jgi:glutamyl-tRNA reductase